MTKIYPPQFPINGNWKNLFQVIKPLTFILVLLIGNHLNAQEQIILGEEFSQFGSSVGISGNTTIIGAQHENAIHFYDYNGSEWVLNSSHAPSFFDAHPQFGRSVAIDGDFAVVGAPFDELDANSFSRGSITIYQRTGNTWTESSKIFASNGSDYDTYGTDVAIHGNYIIVGALGVDIGGSQSGAAYIYHYNGSIWEEQAFLVSSIATANNRAGEVDINGDYAVVGASSGRSHKFLTVKMDYYSVILRYSLFK